MSTEKLNVKSTNKSFATFHVIAEYNYEGKALPDQILFTFDENSFIVEEADQDGFEYILRIKDNPNIKEKLLKKDNQEIKEFHEKILKQYNNLLFLKFAFSKNEINNDILDKTVLYLKAEDFQKSDGRRKSKSRKRKISRKRRSRKRRSRKRSKKY
jgi:hypothetical protein